jgi:hypothetical protein
MSLQNKASTWDVLQKRNFIGPRWCCQCHQVEETIVHLMLECTIHQRGMERGGKFNRDWEFMGRRKS